jgi:hypothetical protein
MWDEHFVRGLMEHPRHAITDTFIKAGVDFSDEMVESLVNELKEFEAEYGFGQILETSHRFVSSGGEVAAI